jgi:hypothetical protein
MGGSRTASSDRQRRAPLWAGRVPSATKGLVVRAARTSRRCTCRPSSSAAVGGVQHLDEQNTLLLLRPAPAVGRCATDLDLQRVDNSLHLLWCRRYRRERRNHSRHRAARHSLRVSGGGVSGGETCGVSGFAPAKLRSVRFRTCETAKCPVSHLRNVRNAKCPVSHFEICEMRSVRFRTCEIQKVSKVIY